MNVTVRKSATASQQQLTSKSGYDHIHVHPVFATAKLQHQGIEQLLSAAAVAAATALSCMQQLDADRGQAIC